MRYLTSLLQIGLLFAFYYIGTWIQGALNLFIPGSVIGMLLLFLLLQTKLLPSRWIAGGASLLISHLPLLFLPVTVGVMAYGGVFAGKGILLILLVLFSTALVMVGAGLASQLSLKRQVQNDD